MVKLYDFAKCHWLIFLRIAFVLFLIHLCLSNKLRKGVIKTLIVFGTLTLELSSRIKCYLLLWKDSNIFKETFLGQKCKTAWAISRFFQTSVSPIYYVVKQKEERAAAWVRVPCREKGRADLHCGQDDLLAQTLSYSLLSTEQVREFSSSKDFKLF